MSSFARKLFILSLVINIIGLVGGILIVEKKGGLPWLSKKISAAFRAEKAQISDRERLTKISVYEELKIEPTDIVFLGDSLFAFGEWREMLEDNRVKNRSISGEETGQILERLDRIVEGQPRHVVMLFGGNNILNGIPYDKTLEQYSQILDMISNSSEHTEFWLLPMIAANEKVYNQWISPGFPNLNMPDKTNIKPLNDFIKNLAAQRPSVHFIDTPFLLNQDGQIKEEFTYDGLHLNGTGLKAIAQRLKKIIQ